MTTAEPTEHVMPLTSLIIQIETRLVRTDRPQTAPTREVLVEIRAVDLNADHLGKTVYLNGGAKRGRICRIERRPNIAAAGGYAVDIVVEGEDFARTYPGATIVQVLETRDVTIQEGLAAAGKADGRAEVWAEYLAFRKAEDRLLCSLGRVEGEHILARMRGLAKGIEWFSTEDALRVAAADALIAYQAELGGLGMPTEKIAAASRRMSIELQTEIANVVSPGSAKSTNGV